MLSIFRIVRLQTCTNKWESPATSEIAEGANMKSLLVRTGRFAWGASTLILIGAAPGASVAADDGRLAGNWKLISWQVVAGNEAQDLFGHNPKGYLLLTPEGRAMVITTADNRKPGTDDAGRAALHKSMLAYTGKYRIEGSDFITTVDVSWNESWNGTEQRRHYRIEGDKLFIESAPAPSIVFPGRTDFRRIVWEREK
jgi:hypothetical protein